MIGAPELGPDEIEALQEVLVDTGAVVEVERRIDELTAMAAEAVTAGPAARSLEAAVASDLLEIGGLRHRPVGARVAVVGAGLGGLAAACHLRGTGHDVTVFERGDRPGGRAGLVERDGLPVRHGTNGADDAGAHRRVLHRGRDHHG